MSLTVGSRLGPYEIVGALGAGGMGEVYKARDTRLDRTVAIKILPPGVASDPERRARFEREAKTIAALSHPNICPLFDVGDRDGSMFLVMEYLAGETLAERLRKGPLPLDQALAIATEIADGLAAAHRQGVIHRDLKPGNVMLTKSGAKLLDFGLAKLRAQGAAIATSVTMSVPTQEPATSAGTILGTIPYMAPEQLEGKETDARSDLFSFGALLYEMLTGKRAFEGASHASLIAAILEHEPAPLSSVQPVTPPTLDRLVRKCLHKDPERRWQTASDVADELRWLASGPPNTGPAMPAKKHSRLARAAPWLVAAACAAVGGVAVFRVPTIPAGVDRFALSFVGQGLLPEGVAVSPDGRAWVFSAKDAQGRRLFLRRLDDWKSTVVEGTAGATDACFSPDGQSVVVALPTGLQRIALSGGRPAPIPNSDDPGYTGTDRIISCGSNGDIVFPKFVRDSGLWRASPSNGWKAEPLKLAENSTVRYLHPHVLPGGRAVLFSVFRQGHASIAALRLDTKEKDVKTVIENAFRGRYVSATGHLVYQQQGHLLGVPFDVDSLQMQGTPAMLEEQVGLGDILRPEFDVSASGTLAYLPQTDVELMWIDRNGARRTVRLDKQSRGITRAAGGVWVALSPAGDRAVIGLVKDGFRRLWVANSIDSEAALVRLTPGDDDFYGVFTPDGHNVLFTSASASGGYNIYLTRADAGGTPVLLTNASSGWKMATSVRHSVAGDVVLYHDTPLSVFDIWQMPLGHPESAKEVVKGPKNEVMAAFSPDGRWIAYVSNESGRSEIYVKGYPEGPKHQVSTDGGTWPRWNPRDGGELFYQKPNAIVAVRIVNGDRAGEPKELFDLPAGYGVLNWDVAPDGQRFLVAETRRPAVINVVRNWFNVLKTKVPAK